MIKDIEGPILLFDGVCNLCNQTVQFIIRADKKELFKFTSLQSATGQSLLTKVQLPTSHFDSIVMIDNNQVYTKSTAALKVCKKLGGIWLFCYPLMLVPKPIRDAFYQMIAKNRYKWFGKSNHCMLPSPEIKKRFL
ncbi:thiol-disulfide oxidoreductase DCC family protein [Metabacillus litoralis]|uniref:Thiol-disulfide oxidoreductase DCC family protein n=1 Tax=Metabacillus litoralis TaxID=152268 RepID=A0A5C6W1U8_9BACI|nr:thiol-disulfide oxidoreductase DCC family protein [Metabacillus litoralis]TXC91255.1 thiol-disulfide oxidoreductase DCC family protein [Metabacillus litoralis]